LRQLILRIKLLAPAIGGGAVTICAKTAFNCCFQAVDLSEACIKQSGKYGAQLSAGDVYFGVRTTGACVTVHLISNRRMDAWSEIPTINAAFWYLEARTSTSDVNLQRCTIPTRMHL
jgi:hypothetical protein